MADEPRRGVPWWTTLPGLLTAATAVVIFVTGLLLVLAREGLLGETDRPDVVGRLQTARAAVRTLGGIEIVPRTSNGPPAPAAPQPYRTVRVTKRDGATADLHDDVLIASAKKVRLENGESIELIRIARIDALEDAGAAGPARARIALMDGTTVDAGIDPSFEVAGRDDRGAFDAHWPEIRSIEFVR